jgi:hypothetical protein
MLEGDVHRILPLPICRSFTPPDEPNSMIDDDQPLAGPVDHKLLFESLPAAAAGRFFPTNDQIRGIVSMFTQPSTGIEQWLVLQQLTLVLVSHIFRFSPPLIDSFVENGFVKAVCPMIHQSAVRELLAQAIRRSRQACFEAIEAHIATELIASLTQAPSQLTEDYITLAGAFGFWSEFAECDPFVGILVDILLSGNFSQKVIEALNSHVRFSDRRCCEFVGSNGFPAVFGLLERSDKTQISVFHLFGSILSRPVVGSGVIETILECMFVFLEQAQSNEVINAILRAVLDGSCHGAAYVQLCCTIVPFLIQKFSDMASFAVKCSMMDCLCALFSAASYETAIGFQVDGFFAIIEEFGETMVEGRSRAIINVLRTIFELAALHGNAEWLEFLATPSVQNLLELLASSPDEEICSFASGILESTGRI